MSDRIERLQSPLGRLTWDAKLCWWESDPIAVALFGGSKARISLEGVADPSLPIKADLLAAASTFLALTPSKLNEIEPHVWQEYVDVREVVGDDEGFPEIDRHNIWQHVHLNDLGIETRDADGISYVDIFCYCDWEPEHGLQLVLQSGTRWVRVSDYSGHLTEGDARDCSELDAWMQDPDAKLPVRTRDATSAMVEEFKRGKR